MNAGRWYPTTVTLRMVAFSYHQAEQPGQQPNPIQQIWDPLIPGTWKSIVDFDGLLLYPRMHVTREGTVFLAGPLKTTYLLKIPPPGSPAGAGEWKGVGDRINGPREDGSCVMYDVSKVLYIGGGRLPPTDAAEVIDLDAANPQWKDVKQKHFARRHCNATLLPDVTVLV